MNYLVFRGFFSLIVLKLLDGCRGEMQRLYFICGMSIHVKCTSSSCSNEQVASASLEAIKKLAGSPKGMVRNDHYGFVLCG